MPPRDVMTIGEFSRRTRVTVKALRLYDRQRLLVPSSVDADSGYRYYHQSQIPIARLIEHLRRIDMPIQRIAAVLDASREDAVAGIASYWREVEERLVIQRRLAEHIWTSLSGQHDGYPTFPVFVRDVPTQRFVTLARPVLQRDIPDFAAAGFPFLLDIAETVGGSKGHRVMIYDDVVNDDEPAFVELAVPIALDAPLPDMVDQRMEPAHREAFTTIDRASLHYPQILSAYDAVFHWMSRHDAIDTGPAREVYFTDVERAAPDEPVCDVAVPIT